MPLYAGVCETNITPPPDGWLGGFDRARRCAGIADELYARALVLDNGHKRVVLLALDLMAGPEEWTRQTRQEIAADLHTEAGAVMLHYTHTRSGPRMPALHGAGEYDTAYMDVLGRKLRGAARQAAADLLPAGLTYGEASAQIGANTRQADATGKAAGGRDYGGPVSSLVQTLCVVGADGQTFALLFAHACSADTGNDGSATLSADWPGAAAAHLKRRFEKEAADTGITSDALPFCLAGCGANVTPLRRGSREAVRTNGRIIADAAHTARWNAHGRLGETLDWTETTLALPLAAPSSHQACPVLHQPFTIQKLNLGGVAVLGFPADMFVEYQQTILAQSMSPVFCLGTTNGCLGRLATEAERERGGYEADGAYQQDAALHFASGCEALIHAAVRDLLPSDRHE